MLPSKLNLDLTKPSSASHNLQPPTYREQRIPVEHIKQYHWDKATHKNQILGNFTEETIQFLQQMKKVIQCWDLKYINKISIWTLFRSLFEKEMLWKKILWDSLNYLQGLKRYITQKQYLNLIQILFEKRNVLKKFLRQLNQ